MPPIDTPYTDILKLEPSTNPLGLSNPGSPPDSARLNSARPDSKLALAQVQTRAPDSATAQLDSNFTISC